MAFLIVPLVAIGLILAVVMVVPLIASVIATSILGRAAKLEFDSGVALGFIFYLFMWLFMWLYMCGANDAGLLLAIGYVFAALIWPLPVGYAMLGVTTGGTAVQVWLIVAAAFAATQCFAVMMILRNAKKTLEGDKNLDKY